VIFATFCSNVSWSFPVITNGKIVSRRGKKPFTAELDGIEISDVDLNLGK